MSRSGFDPYHRWLGIPASEQPPNYYRLLGLVLFESDSEVIDSAAMRQIAHVRSHAIGPHGDVSQAILNELAEARRTLLDPISKRSYDQSLDRYHDGHQPTPESTGAQTSLVCPVCRSVVLIESKYFGEVVQCGRCQAIWRVSADGSQCYEVQGGAATGAHESDADPSINSGSSRFPDIQEEPTQSLRLKTRRQTNKKSKSAITGIQIAAVPVGGLMGIGLAVLILWAGFGVDPLGLFSGDEISQTNENIPVVRQPLPVPKPSENKRVVPSNLAADISKPEEPMEIADSRPPEPESMVSEPSGPTQEERDFIDGVLKAASGRVNPRVLNWKDVTGEFGTQASLVSQTDSEINLESADGETLVVEKIKIDTTLIGPVHLAWLRQQDALQYSELKPLLMGSVQPSEVGATTASEAYLSLHRKYKASPYAGLVAAVGLSMDNNDVKAASVILRDVVDRLRKHRELAPQSHRLTLSTALNNLAVCSMKEGKGSAAAAMFQEAGEILAPSLLPPTLHENILLMQRIDPKNPVVRVTARQISDLTQSLSEQIPKELLGKEASYLKYSLIWDLPYRGVISGGSTTSLSPTQIAGLPQIARDGVIVSSGFGFLAADGLVVTNASLFRDGFWAPDQTVIRTYQLENGPAKALTVSELIFGAEETDSGIVLLKVPAGQGVPLPLAASEVGRDEAYWITQPSEDGDRSAGYKLVSTDVTHESAFLKEQGLRDLIAFELRDSIPTELSGMPVIDALGNAVGMSCADPYRSYSLFRGLAIPSAAIKGLLFSQPNPIVLPKIVEDLKGSAVATTSLQAAVAQSLFKIDVWVDIKNVPGAYGLINGTDLNTQYADHWCIRCSGSGTLKCPNRACNLGRIFNKVKEVVEIEPRTKTPIYGDRVFYTPCEVCAGKGKVDCNLCKDGKY